MPPSKASGIASSTDFMYSFATGLPATNSTLSGRYSPAHSIIFTLARPVSVTRQPSSRMGPMASISSLASPSVESRMTICAPRRADRRLLLISSKAPISLP